MVQRRVGRGLEPAGRALEPAERASEQAGRVRKKKEGKKKQSFTSM